MIECNYGGTKFTNYKDSCKLSASVFLKFFTPSKNSYFMIPYCDNHAIGYEHILRVSKEEFDEYMIECEVEDLLES